MALSRACRAILQLTRRLRCNRGLSFGRGLLALLATHVRMTQIFLGLDMISDPLLQDLSLWKASFGFAIPEEYCLHFGCFLLCNMCRSVLTCRLQALRRWRKGQRDVKYASRRRDESNLSNRCTERAKEFLGELRASQPSCTSCSFCRRVSKRT